MVDWFKCREGISAEEDRWNMAQTTRNVPVKNVRGKFMDVVGGVYWSVIRLCLKARPAVPVETRFPAITVKAEKCGSLIKRISFNTRIAHDAASILGALVKKAIFLKLMN
ncbi:hypothetical protein ABGM91_03475 [Akkermansia muciniphila]|uniref:hypothetical protein n=1 Tax=Akkermansia muciniphila TaxID=239935 RepID=UPI0033A06155